MRWRRERVRDREHKVKRLLVPQIEPFLSVGFAARDEPEVLRSRLLAPDSDQVRIERVPPDVAPVPGVELAEEAGETQCAKRFRDAVIHPFAATDGLRDDFARVGKN